MSLTYSDEQVALKDSAEKVLKERYTTAQRGSPGSFWPIFADLGWLGLSHRSDLGGADGSMIEIALLAEAMGRHLVSEPYTSHIFAAELVEAIATRPQAEQLIPALCSGKARLLVAHEDARASAVTSADAAHRLSGHKSPILDAHAASAALVAAQRPDGTAGVYLVQPSDASLATFPTVDGRIAARLRLDGTPSEPLGSGDQTAAIALALDRAVTAQIADLTGAMQAALEATVAYAKLRVQFGQPIGANQVIKHRLVQMAVQCEEARSLALLAAIRTSDGCDATVRRRAVSGAKVKVLKMARAVTEDAVQIHGGMGVTDELEIGSYLKRVIAAEATLGTARVHRQRYRDAAAAVD